MNRRYFFLWIPVVLVLGAIALTRLSFNVDPLDVLPDDVGGVKELRIFSEQFSGKGELIITLERDQEDVSAEARSLAECLQGTEGLASWVEWQPLWEEDPDIASQLPAYVWLNGSQQGFQR